MQNVMPESMQNVMVESMQNVMPESMQNVMPESMQNVIIYINGPEKEILIPFVLSSNKLSGEPVQIRRLVWHTQSIDYRSSPEVMKLFPYSQLSTKIIKLLLAFSKFMSMVNTTSERLKAKNFFICRYFRFYEQLKFEAELS